MKNLSSMMMLAASLALLPVTATALPVKIFGNIPPGGLTLLTNGNVTGNVFCQAVTVTACIKFGAPNLVLNLNGFQIMGGSVPIAACPSGGAPGLTAIDTNGQTNAQIHGPGLITGFTNFGILLTGSNSIVNRVVITYVCATGILVDNINNVVQHNSISRFGLAGGNAGIALGEAFSSHHQIKYNTITGSGAGPDSPPEAQSGAGIYVFSDNNTIEYNNTSGNAIGIWIDSIPGDGSAIYITGNVVDNNQALGNGYNDPFGDIYDSNPAGSNTYSGNLCQIAAGTGVPGGLCPGLPVALIGNP